MSESINDEMLLSTNGMISEIDHTIRETSGLNDDETTWLDRSM